MLKFLKSTYKNSPYITYRINTFAVIFENFENSWKIGEEPDKTKERQMKDTGL